MSSKNIVLTGVRVIFAALITIWWVWLFWQNTHAQLLAWATPPASCPAGTTQEWLYYAAAYKTYYKNTAWWIRDYGTAVGQVHELTWSSLNNAVNKLYPGVSVTYHNTKALWFARIALLSAWSHHNDWRNPNIILPSWVGAYDIRALNPKGSYYDVPSNPPAGTTRLNTFTTGPLEEQSRYNGQLITTIQASNTNYSYLEFEELHPEGWYVAWPYIRCVWGGSGTWGRTTDPNPVACVPYDSAIHGTSTTQIPVGWSEYAVILSPSGLGVIWEEESGIGWWLGLSIPEVKLLSSSSYSFSGDLGDDQYLLATIKNLLPNDQQFIQFKKKTNNTIDWVNAPFYGCNVDQWITLDPFDDPQAYYVPLAIQQNPLVLSYLSPIHGLLVRNTPSTRPENNEFEAKTRNPAFSVNCQICEIQEGTGYQRVWERSWCGISACVGEQPRAAGTENGLYHDGSDLSTYITQCNPGQQCIVWDGDGRDEIPDWPYHRYWWLNGELWRYDVLITTSGLRRSYLDIINMSFMDPQPSNSCRSYDEYQCLAQSACTRHSWTTEETKSYVCQDHTWAIVNDSYCINNGSPKPQEETRMCPQNEDYPVCYKSDGTLTVDPGTYIYRGERDLAYHYPTSWDTIDLVVHECTITQNSNGTRTAEREIVDCVTQQGNWIQECRGIWGSSSRTADDINDNLVLPSRHEETGGN